MASKNRKPGKGSMNARQIAKLLKGYGFRIVSKKGKGSHAAIVNRDGKVVATVVITGVRSKSYVGSILKDIGLDPKDVFA